MRNNSILFSLFVSFLLLVGCGMAKTAAEDVTEGPPSRQKIQRQAARASVWRFVYCLEESTDGTALVDLLNEIAATQPFNKRIEVVNCQALSADTLGSGPIALFGDRLPEAPPQTAPLKSEGANWQIPAGRNFGGDDVLLLPLYRNPWSEGNTVSSFFLSNNLQRLGEQLKKAYADEWGRMFWRNWAYEIHRANGDRIYGAYKDTTWQFDAEAEVALLSPEEPVYEEGGLKIFSLDGVIPPAEVSRIVSSLNWLQQTVDTLSDEAPDWHPEVRLYPNLERIGFRLNKMAPIQYEADKNRLHLVPSFLEQGEIPAFFDAWYAYLDHYHPKQQEESRDHLVGTLLYLNKDRLPTKKLYKHCEDDNLCSFKEANKYFRLGREITLQYHGNYEKLLPELLAGKAAIPREEKAAFLPVTNTAREVPQNFLAGMTFAHEGYRIHNGYGGEKIKYSLDSLAQLRVNALAIVPYTFMRDPNKAVPLFIPRGAHMENDWATAFSVREAKAKGWFTLLKPQIWVGGGHWPGDVAFDTEEKWTEWFEHYRYWIMHYAMLAEREQVDALCLGTELVQTTVHHPERWRRIIADVRKVYGGQLTYAANWGEEFENFSFWDDLDAIGLNSYYPIHEGEQFDQAALHAGAKRWMKMAGQVSREQGKPLWLTEVGFRSVVAPWQHPHAEAGERAVNNAHQQACFEALAAAARETPELRGMFVWKWPSSFGSDRRSKGFTPAGKPAAQTLARFYGEQHKTE